MAEKHTGFSFSLKTGNLSSFWGFFYVFFLFLLIGSLDGRTIKPFLRIISNFFDCLCSVSTSTMFTTTNDFNWQILKMITAVFILEIDIKWLIFNDYRIIIY